MSYPVSRSWDWPRMWASRRARCSATGATCTARSGDFPIQRELPKGFVGQIGYMGNSGVKLFARQYINNVDPVTKVRPLPTFGRMDEKRQDGKSNFNALQLSLHRRVARGLNWGTEYMWSHTINDGNIGSGEGVQPQIATLPSVRSRQQPAGHPPHDHQQLDLPAAVRPGTEVSEHGLGVEDPGRLGNRAASGRRARGAC